MSTCRNPAASLEIFLLVFALTHPLLISSISLQSFIGCAVREFTFIARKPGCRSLRVKTDACWGRCETWERPILEEPYIESYHRLCTYNRTRHSTVRLTGCRRGINPAYTYPVAVTCECSMCSTETTECETV